MAKLTSKWWAGVRPKGVGGDLEAALKDFEKAVRGGNGAEVLDSLIEVTMGLEAARGDAKKVLKANPVKRNAILLELKEMQRLIDRENDLVVRKGTKAIKVWSRDFAKAVDQQHNLGFLQVNGGMIELKLDLMTIHALENAGAEARLIRELNDIFDTHVERFCDKIDTAISNNNGFALSKQRAYALTADGKKAVTILRKHVEGQAERAIAGAYAHHKAAKTFKKKRAFEITVATLGVAGSAAGIAMPGTTAVAVVTLIRSTAKLVEEVVNLLMTLEKKYESLVFQLKQLQASFNRGKRDLKEVGKTTVNALVGAGVMVTYKAVNDRMDDFKGSISVVADRVNKAQRKIFATIAKLDDLDKSIDKVVQDKRKFWQGSLGKEVAGLRKELDKMLDKMSDTMGRVVTAERQVPKLDKAIDDLGDSSLTVKRAEKAIPFCVNLAFSLGSMSDGIAASQSALNVTANVLGSAGDIAGELKDLAA